MEGKKVLFIHHGGIAGGAPLSMLYTMLGVRERGYSPIVGLVNPMPELHELYNSNGFETFEMKYIPFFIVWSGFEGEYWRPTTWKRLYELSSKWRKGHEGLRRFLSEQDIDFVHLNSMALVNAADLLNKMNFPYVWHIREHGPKHKGFRFRFLRKRLRAAKNIIFLSKAEQKSWLSANDKGVVIHNFINFDQFDYSKINKEAALDSLGVEKGKKIILYVGGTKLHKGIIPLLDSLKLIKEKYGNNFVCLMPDTFFPEGQKMNRVVKQVYKIINDTGISDVCKLMPFNPNIVEMFGACDILVFPALQPHFARPIIEASAMKKPVIASDLSAIDELVVNNKTGYLIPANDKQVLTEKILYLFNNEDVCEQFGSAGYKFALENFEYEKQIDKVISIYKNIFND